jgi:hypothetical protein
VCINIFHRVYTGIGLVAGRASVVLID